MLLLWLCHKKLFYPGKHETGRNDLSACAVCILSTCNTRIKCTDGFYNHGSRASLTVVAFITYCEHPPQWGAADAEIKVPSGENTELKHSPFKAWSRSVYSHTRYVLLPGISSLLISTLLVHSPAFFPKPLPIFPVLAVAYTWFLCRPAE